MMRFVNPFPLVSDMARSVAFYKDVLGMRPTEITPEFAAFDGGFALHSGAEMLKRLKLLGRGSEAWGRDNLVLYFEVNDLDAEWRRIKPLVQAMHGPRQEPPAQYIARLRDPDGHIVEIGQCEGEAQHPPGPKA